MFITYAIGYYRQASGEPQRVSVAFPDSINLETLIDAIEATDVLVFEVRRDDVVLFSGAVQQTDLVD